jgi:diguanylate cyclase (GGDEF)-like protein/hemerythrin-like metal-binding protein
MMSDFVKACRHSIQFKLFLSLTAIVALSLTAILASQVYLVQEYFIRQAESNLRSSNYLLSRVLADPLYANDLSLLQTRLQEVQGKLPLCNFQLKDNIGRIVFKVGEVRLQSDSEFDPNSRDGCYNTVLPVVHGDTTVGTVRMGVRTDDIAQARQNLIHESAFFALFWFVLLMLPFFLQIRRLVRPLGNLSKAAQQFADGNLDYPTPLIVQGEDEISQLTSSFQGMAQALVHHRDTQAANLAALNNEKSTLDALLATMPVGVIFADRNHIRYCNTAFSRMCLLDPNEQLIGMKNETMLLRLGQIADDADSFLRYVAEILETRTLTESKYFDVKDGRTLRMISNTVIEPDGHGYLGRFWLFVDATEEKKTLQMAELRGQMDSLTMLYNRNRFDQDLPRQLAQAERDSSRLALLVFDLDDFKPINDQYGHASGDIVLKQISQSLSVQLRRNEVLYRVGGDEFALLLINTNDEVLEKLAARIVQTIHSLVFDFNGRAASVGCSLGIARYPYDAKTLPELMQLADQAMYVAKKKGKNQYFFCNSLQDVAPEVEQQSPKLEQPSPALQNGDINLGISIMDAQHMSIAHFIKDIIDSLTSGDKSTKLLKRVELLVELCKINFQTEEELMKLHNIHGLEEYQNEHQRQLKSLRSLFGNLSFNEQQLATLTHDIHNWLQDHIRGQDTALAAQLISKGIT